MSTRRMMLILIGAFFALLAAIAVLWAIAGSSAAAVLGVLLILGLTAALVWLWRRMDRDRSPM